MTSVVRCRTLSGSLRLPLAQSSVPLFFQSVHDDFLSYDNWANSWIGRKALSPSRRLKAKCHKGSEQGFPAQVESPCPVR